MNRYEKACQLWSVLALSAHLKHEVSVAELANFTGVPVSAVKSLLEPIHKYCLLHKIPDLTCLLDEAGVNKAQVLSFEWQSQGCPSGDSLSQAERAIMAA